MSLRRLLGDRLYLLQLWRDRFELRDLHSGEVISEPPLVVLGDQAGKVVFVAAGHEALSMALEEGMRRTVRWYREQGLLLPPTTGASHK